MSLIAALRCPPERLLLPKHRDQFADLRDERLIALDQRAARRFQLAG
jgi:hypothetical protein